MPLYATIDQGNTATKLTVWRDSEPVARMASKTLAAADVAATLAAYAPLDAAI